MNKEEYKEFVKRYDKFKKNNLPTSFWDKERQTLEYVSYDSELDYWNNVFKSEDDEFDRKLHVDRNLIEALENLADTGFYYPYTCGYFTLAKKGDKSTKLKIEFGHTHSHSFEQVVRDLYDFPESFKIESSELEYYSKQQLDYLRRVQKYLLFIGLKDVDSNKPSVKRYRNELQKKYGVASIHSYPQKTLDDFISGKRNFIVIVTDYIDSYKEYEEYPNHDRKELMVDLEDNFKLFVEYTHHMIKTYKDIKNVYYNENLQDDDKVVVEYFKILEVLDN